MFNRGSKKNDGSRAVGFRKGSGALLNRFFSDDMFPLSSALWEDMAFPRFDMSEGDKEITIQAEVPGVDKKDIQVTIHGRTMTIQGDKKQEQEEKTKNFHRIERTYGSFKRTIRLPAEVDEKTVKASYKRGVLKIVLKKQTESRSKKIEIKTN